MRLVLNSLVFLMTFAIIAFVGAGYWGIGEYKKPGPLSQPAVFAVEKGQSVIDIAQNLHAQNIISNPLVFRLGAKYLNNDISLKAGEYELEPGMSMAGIIAKMQSGLSVQYQITVPECVTAFEVMTAVNAIEMLDDALPHPPVEGTLFPETYNYIRGEKKQDVIARMQSAMDMHIERLWRLKTTDNEFIKTPQDLLTMASIVEKEAGKPEERRRVAGLFFNRLKQGMRLQSDPTVIYGIVDGQPKTGGVGPLGRRLLKKDLDFDSPYNTYLYGGLPPGPICNPGLSSIEAVLNPEAHDYIYMVADGTGGHAFATHLRDHNANVAKWRQVRAGQESAVPDDVVPDDAVQANAGQESAVQEAPAQNSAE